MSLAHRVRGCWQAMCVPVWIRGTWGCWQVWNVTPLSGSMTNTLHHYLDLTGQVARPWNAVHTKLTHKHTPHTHNESPGRIGIDGVVLWSRDVVSGRRHYGRLQQPPKKHNYIVLYVFEQWRLSLPAHKESLDIYHRKKRKTYFPPISTMLFLQ